MLLAATDSLDIWRCEDELTDDTLWTKITGFPSNIIAFAVTSDGTGLAFTTTQIYKSIDNGVTWNYWKNLPHTMRYGGISNNLKITAPIINIPVDNLIIYVGTDNQLYKSEDGGTTWNSVAVSASPWNVSQICALTLSSVEPSSQGFYFAKDETAENYIDGQTIGPSASSEVEEASSGNVDVGITVTDKLVCDTTNSSQVAAVKKNSAWVGVGTDESTFKMKCKPVRDNDFYVQTVFLRVNHTAVPTPDTNANLDTNSNLVFIYYYSDYSSNPRIRVKYKDNTGTWQYWNGSAWGSGVANSFQLNPTLGMIITIKRPASTLTYEITVKDSNGTLIMSATTGNYHTGGDQYIEFGMMETDFGFNFHLEVDWFSWSAIVAPPSGDGFYVLGYDTSAGAAWISRTNDNGVTWQLVWDDQQNTYPMISDWYGVIERANELVCTAYIGG